MANPTHTNSWRKLSDHINSMRYFDLKSEFSNNLDRSKQFVINSMGIYFDYSKNLVTKETMGLLIELAKEQGVPQMRSKMFKGEKINFTENRAVLHTALRDFTSDVIEVDDKNAINLIETELQKMGQFVKAVRTGSWRGYTGKRITDVVNIGIGGSDLGPKMAVSALGAYKDSKIKAHFISNIDGANTTEILSKLHQETTLFIVTSKKFTTLETIKNAKSAKKWFLDSAGQEKYVSRHFVAVSSNFDAAVDFGISAENVFEIWDFIGGRYSMWSAVGLPIALSIGYDNFIEMLEGAHEMDRHFLASPLESNIPVILAMLNIWYINFHGAETNCILPYSYDLRYLPSYLQQLEMESNGKSIDRDGNRIEYKTAPIVWGASGTDMQHSFFQLILQGTRLVPADFIGFNKDLSELKDHHNVLMSNFVAATEALLNGKSDDDINKIVEPNKPSTTILCDELSPKTLGKLIAMYEHKIFVEGVVWNINSFDQFGVELGKKLAEQIEDEIMGKADVEHDSSTKGLISEIIS